MCLIALAIDAPGPWLLVVAANRDEFHDRHAAQAAYWSGTQQGIFAGRDLQGGGTWLGLRRTADDRLLRVGALTNLRPALMPPPQAPALPDAVPPSRGGLVAAYLAADAAPCAFLEGLDPPPGAYAGFNVLAMELDGAGDGVEACYLNNLPGSRPRRLEAGVHVVSNATLDVEWPKTRLLGDAMMQALALERRRAVGKTGGMAAVGVPADGHADELDAVLLEALSDRSTASPCALPSTGLAPEREQLLSAPFIVDDHYGTRCSTVIGVGRDGAVFFTERRFGPGGRPLGTVRERFRLDWSAGPR